MVHSIPQSPFIEARTALTARLWRAAEMQAAEVEARIASGPRPAAEAEKDARVLSVLARTLKDLSGIDTGDTLEEGAADDPEDQDGIPGDIEALRSALHRKLLELKGEGLHAAPSDA